MKVCLKFFPICVCPWLSVVQLIPWTLFLLCSPSQSCQYLWTLQMVVTLRLLGNLGKHQWFFCGEDVVSLWLGKIGAGQASDDILICCGTTALTYASCLNLIFTLCVYGHVSMFVHTLALLPCIIQSFSATPGDANHKNFNSNQIEPHHHIYL